MKKKSILFVHKTFPGQFGGLAKHLDQNGWEVKFLTLDKDATKRDFARQAPTVDIHQVSQAELPEFKGHKFLKRLDQSVRLAEAFQVAAARLCHKGFEPDIIMPHSGWGVGSLLPSVWPNAIVVPFLEWWYNFPARDVPEQVAADRTVARRGYAGVRNLMFLNDLQHAKAVICPTNFQAAEFPPWLKSMTKVVHDGVDCSMFSPGSPQKYSSTNLGIPDGAPIVTYATRGMEPIRGFPNFMAAVSILQKKNKNVHIVIAGEDRIQYGATKGKASYKDKALREHAFDMERLHFVGTLPLDLYRDLLRMSDVHTYLSNPFVLSWSLVHAMAVGCCLVVSDNDMLREPLIDEGHASFVNDKSPNDIAAKIESLLADGNRRAGMRKQVRKRALAIYDEANIHPAKEKLLRQLLQPNLN